MAKEFLLQMRALEQLKRGSVENDEIVLDTSGTECPIPVLKARKLAQELKKEIIIKVVATDPLATADFEHYCKQSGYEFLESYNENEKIIIRYKFKN
jgi:tRNA 2-thiouridine synthesizing protein A